MFGKCSKQVSRLFQGSFNSVSKVFQRLFRKFSWDFQGCCHSVSWKLGISGVSKGSFKNISRQYCFLILLLLGSHRSYPSKRRACYLPLNTHRNVISIILSDWASPVTADGRLYQQVAIGKTHRRNVRKAVYTRHRRGVWITDNLLCSWGGGGGGGGGHLTGRSHSRLFLPYLQFLSMSHA